MSYQPKILVFAGSLRKGSYNKQLAKIAAKAAEDAGAQVTYLDLADYPLPVYDGDVESKEGLPANAIKLKELMLKSDGFIISSPEYNSSISGALKNVIDWTSRTINANEPPLICYRDKVALIISASVGGLGGLRGLVHLRAILENINTFVLPGQKTIANASEAFDHDGNLKSEEAQKAIYTLSKKLVETISKLKS